MHQLRAGGTYKKITLSVLTLSLLPFSLLPVSVLANDIEEVVVFSKSIVADTLAVSPNTSIRPSDLKAINLTTTEDILANVSNVVVRRRFIGDLNGVIGIRGSNMFQTPRSMVFVDGMPIHYHLQTRFRGSPRWSLVSPSEVEQAEVIYGPFSAEYSGNAMGGVVNLHTRKPDKERLTLEAGYFFQPYDRLETSETYDGYRFHAAYENKFGSIGSAWSYTRLENDSHPQVLLRSPISTDSSGNSLTGGTSVTGSIAGIDEHGTAVEFYGDSGPERAVTELYKTKFTVDLDSIEIRASVAYEERSRAENRLNNYLLDDNGSPFYGDTFNVNGSEYSAQEFGRSVFQEREQIRKSLLAGIGLKVFLGNNWISDIFYSHFDLIEDEEIRSGASPASSDYLNANNNFRGRLTSYDDSGWNTLDIKFSNNAMFDNANQRFAAGMHYNSYELNYILDDYNSITNRADSNELDGNLETGRGDSGGKAKALGLFAQYGLNLSDSVTTSLGLRYERWEAKDGYIAAATPGDFSQLNNSVTYINQRSESGFSPKFSISKSLTPYTTIRYSVARALRFPVVEELFVNGSDTAGSSISAPNLRPERGVFHNVSYIRNSQHSTLKIHLFYDTVEDTIFNQTVVDGASGTVETFLPINEVETRGAELSLALPEFVNPQLNIALNLAYTDTKITDNPNNPSIEGNQFPRIAKWRSSILLDYSVSETLSFGSSVRYASDTYGDLDNSDTSHNVFGAHDNYVFVGFKANWQASEELLLSTGIDNAFDDQAYVRFTYPGRTYYFNASYRLGY